MVKAKNKKMVTRILLGILIVGIIGGIYISVWQYNLYTSQIPPIWYKTDLVGQYDMGVSNANDMVVSGDYAYVASSLDGLYIFNITDPSDPLLVGHTSGLSSHALAVAGNIVYLACDGGMLIFNVSDPTHPTQIGEYLVNSSRTVYELTVANDVAYITIPFSFPTNYVALTIVNVSNPVTPKLIGSFSCTSVYSEPTVSGNILCLADGKTGMIIYNIANPSDPKELYLYSYYGYAPYQAYVNARNVNIINNTVYLTDAGKDLIIINILNPSKPENVSFFSMVGNAFDNSVDGHVAYVSYLTGGFLIADLSNMTNPTLIGNYTGGYATTHIKVINNYAYLIDITGLKIVQITPGSGKENYPIAPFDPFPIIAYFAVLAICVVVPIIYIRIPENL